MPPVSIDNMSLADASAAAQLAFRQKHYEDASSYYSRVLSLLNDDQHVSASAYIYYQLGLCYQELFQYQTAEMHFENAFLKILEHHVSIDIPENAFLLENDERKINSFKLSCKYGFALARIARFNGDFRKSSGPFILVLENIEAFRASYPRLLSDVNPWAPMFAELSRTISENKVLTQAAENTMIALTNTTAAFTEEAKQVIDRYLATEPDNFIFRLTYIRKLLDIYDNDRLVENYGHIFSTLLRSIGKSFPTTPEEYKQCADLIIPYIIGTNEPDAYETYYHIFYYPMLNSLAATNNTDFMGAFDTVEIFYQTTAPRFLQSPDFKNFKKLRNEVAAMSPVELAETLNKSGTIRFKAGDFVHAVGYFRKSVEYLQNNQESKDWAACHYNLGRCYQNLGQHSEALPILTIAATTLIKQYQNTRQVDILTNVAKYSSAWIVSLRELQQTDVARETIDTVLNLTDWDKITDAKNYIAQIKEAKTALQPAAAPQPADVRVPLQASL